MSEGYVPNPKYGKMPPKLITVERYEEMLNVMPPSRWYRGEYMQWFHVCERLSGNIVAWFAVISVRHNPWYVEFQDEADLTKQQIIDILVDAARLLGPDQDPVGG